MSKDITIQKNGVPQRLNADKIKTNVVGGGTCFWVPEDEVILTSKNIYENGEYSAESDSAYGYSVVTVNVAGGDGTITGYDEDGDEAMVYVDPVTGELVIEKKVG